MVTHVFCCRFLFINKELRGNIQIEPNSALNMMKLNVFLQSINRLLARMFCLAWRAKSSQMRLNRKTAFDCVNFTFVVHKHCFLG